MTGGNSSALFLVVSSLPAIANGARVRQKQPGGVILESDGLGGYKGVDCMVIKCPEPTSVGEVTMTGKWNAVEQKYSNISIATSSQVSITIHPVEQVFEDKACLSSLYLEFSPKFCIPWICTEMDANEDAQVLLFGTVDHDGDCGGFTEWETMGIRTKLDPTDEEQKLREKHAAQKRIQQRKIQEALWEHQKYLDEQRKRRAKELEAQRAKVAEEVSHEIQNHKPDTGDLTTGCMVIECADTGSFMMKYEKYENLDTYDSVKIVLPWGPIHLRSQPIGRVFHSTDCIDSLTQKFNPQPCLEYICTGQHEECAEVRVGGIIEGGGPMEQETCTGFSHSGQMCFAETSQKVSNQTTSTTTARSTTTTTTTSTTSTTSGTTTTSTTSTTTTTSSTSTTSDEPRNNMNLADEIAMQRNWGWQFNDPWGPERTCEATKEECLLVMNAATNSAMPGKLLSFRLRSCLSSEGHELTELKDIVGDPGCGAPSVIPNADGFATLLPVKIDVSYNYRSTTAEFASPELAFPCADVLDRDS